MTTRATEDAGPGSALRFAPLLLPLLMLGCATATPSGEPAVDPVVCRVNTGEILRSQVEAEKRKLLPAANFHGAVDEADQQAMRRTALQSLIDEELEYQDARRRGLSVDRDKVESEYTRLADRYGGRKAFKARINRSGIAAKEILAALERDFLIAKVNDLVANREREVSEEETRRYFAEHADSFQLPRRAEVRQILLYMPPLEREPDDWTRAVERANALRARVEAGESFAELAAEHSHASEAERASGGRIGTVHPGQLKAPLDAALWLLEVGEVSQPIREFKGVYLLTVDDFVAARALAYEEIEPQLARLVQKKRREQSIADWQASLHDAAEIEILDPSLAPASKVPLD